MMQDPLAFARPRECRPAVLFGNGSSADVGGRPEIEAARSILVLRSGSAARSGCTEPLLRGLDQRHVALIDDTGQHVPAGHVAAAVEEGRRQGSDLIISIGGGSALGLGKAVSVELGTPDAGVPHVAVPTTYAGSEQTARYGVTANGVKQVRDDERARPVLAVYDPLLTLSLAPRVTAESGVNALAHCVEILMLEPADPECRLVAMEGLERIVRALPDCVARGGDVDARSEMMVGAMMASRAVVMVPTALHHGLCHVLGGRTGASHGGLNAALLSHVVEANAEAAPEAMSAMAARLGLPDDGAPAGVRLARFLRSFNDRLGLASGLSALGVVRQDLPGVAEAAFSKPQCHRNPAPLGSAGDILAILERAWAGAA